ncbi:hypothetical protein M0802_013334 [Mischocyttarus mexicanus]|nr:hypothetical protein M0802_013334 [Mischocyttarus mexicanus]
MTIPWKSDDDEEDNTVTTFTVYEEKYLEQVVCIYDRYSLFLRDCLSTESKRTRIPVESFCGFCAVTELSQLILYSAPQLPSFIALMLGFFHYDSRPNAIHRNTGKFGHHMDRSKFR